MRFTVRISLFLFALIFMGGLNGVNAQDLIVRGISVSGNKKTKPQVVTRAMNFGIGDTINRRELGGVLRLNKNNIYNVGLFNEVLIKDSIFGADLFLTISVTERWYVFPIPRLAFEERTINEWWQDKDIDRLVYGLAVDWKNFTGRNDDFWIFFQNGYSRRFDVYYTLPFLFPKKRIGLLLGYTYSNRKEVGYGTINGRLQMARLPGIRMQESHFAMAGIEKQFNPRMGFKAHVSFNWYQPSDSIATFTKRYLSADNLRLEHYPTLYFKFWRDERDVHAYPLKGFKYYFQAAFSGLPGNLSTTRFGKVEVGFSHFIPLRKRLYFCYSNTVSMLIGNRVPYYEKAFLGFDYFVRGYERYVVDGSFFNVTKAEIKYAIIPRKIVHVRRIPFRQFRDFPLGLYVTAFTDLGFVSDETYNNNDETLKNKYLTGYGIGLNFLSMYDSKFRLEYSFNGFRQHGVFLDARLAVK